MQCVEWSPSGASLAFACHDSSLHVVTFPDGTKNNAVQQSVRFASLPLLTLKFINETALVGGGHDCNPMLFAGNGSAWCVVSNSIPVVFTRVS